MLALGSSHRFYLHRGPTDMRKGFDGLCGLVRSGMKRDPLSGDVYVFINRRRTHIKLLVWDRSGFVLYYKRLEEGTFELPVTGTPDWTQVVCLLEGVSLRSVRYRRRYSRPVAASDSKFGCMRGLRECLFSRRYVYDGCVDWQYRSCDALL